MTSISSIVSESVAALRTWKFWKEFIIMTVGMAITSMAVYYFLVPSKLIIGTTSGLAIVISAALEAVGINVKVSVTVTVINVLLLLLSFVLVGGEFGVKTVYATIVLGPMMDLCDALYPYTNFLTEPGQISVMGDPWFDLCCFVLLLSASQALLFNINASTGGLDIAAKIVSKYTHMDIGTAVSVSGGVICLTAFAINSFQMVVIGLIGTWLNGVVIDYFTASINRRKIVHIVSHDYEKIQNYIIKELVRGCTLHPATGGFSNEESIQVDAILNSSEFSELMAFIKKNEINAFIYANNVSEVYGVWFSRRHRKELKEKKEV